MQKRRNASALAMESCFFWIKPSIYDETSNAFYLNIQLFDDKMWFYTYTLIHFN